MAIHMLSNEALSIFIDDLGAQLVGVTGKSGINYLWDGDAAWWSYRSPILFPFVGGLNGRVYRYQGRVYPMTQHGFARNMVFDLVEKSSAFLRHRLCSSCETMEQYPFPFQLDAAFQLEGNAITVGWEVVNTGESAMYFSIGAHPAFLCPPRLPDGPVSRYDCSIALDCDQKFSYRMLDKGQLMPQTYEMPLTQGRFPITPDAFDHDALIVENNQAHQVSLLDKEKNPFVSVSFDAPLFGLWSPPGGAPFVCIEPWYGRCDPQGFSGSLEQREYTNVLEPGETFSASYVIRLPMEAVR